MKQPAAAANSSGPVLSRASGWINTLLIFLFVFLLHFAGTSVLPLLDRDEPRFAEASREMRQRGDWKVPYLNNEYRFDKPPMIYWLQAGCFKLLGESDWVARLPSVLASALTAVAIYGFGRRIWGDPVGLWAALIYSTGLQVLVHSKLCVADPLMILFVTLGAWAGWEIILTGRAPRRGLAFWFWSSCLIGALTLGFLAKGPIAWLPLGMLLWARWRRIAGAPSGISLLLIFLASLVMTAGWAVPALLATHGEYFRIGIGHHVVARGLMPLENHGTRGVLSYLALLPFYLVTIFASFFPWSCWLPGMLQSLRSRAALQEIESYLLSGVIVIFGIFTFYNTRLPHYTLPAFPMLALLTARHCVFMGQRSSALRNCVLAMAALDLALACGFFPALRGWFPSPQLAQASAGLLQPKMEFAAAGFDEPSLLWYFRKHIAGFGSSLPVGKLPAFMARPGARFCILPEQDAARLFPTLPSGWTNTPPVSGINVANGQRVILRVLIKPE